MPHKSLISGAFFLFGLALAGIFKHRQVRFSYGMADGIISVDAMRDARYHAMIFRLGMVLKVRNLLIYKWKSHFFLLILIMVF